MFVDAKSQKNAYPTAFSSSRRAAKLPRHDILRGKQAGWISGSPVHRSPASASDKGARTEGPQAGTTLARRSGGRQGAHVGCALVMCAGHIAGAARPQAGAWMVHLKRFLCARALGRELG